MTIEDFIKTLEQIRDVGGSYCFECGIIFDTVIEARKHDVEKHYDYVLAQCSGDKKLLLASIKELEGVPKNFTTLQTKSDSQ